FTTGTTYGSRLRGDERGWVKRGTRDVQPPDPQRKKQARALMTGEEVVLSREQREIVDAVLVRHCRIRKWVLHARNVRTNHVHVVVTAPVDARIVREQLKAWGSRRLSEAARILGTGKDGRQRWWSEKGDIELVYDDDHLSDVIHYVLELQ